jgi:hypothetical protein
VRHAQGVPSNLPRIPDSFGITQYCLHIVPPLRRVQALLDLQTVNAQKNLEKELKSNLDRMIRSDLRDQPTWARE